MAENKKAESKSDKVKKPPVKPASVFPYKPDRIMHGSRGDEDGGGKARRG